MRKKKEPRPKLIYEESYVRPGLKILPHCLPTMPSAAPGFIVDSAYILKAGSVELEGQPREFQDVRIYFREVAASRPPEEPSR